MSKKDDFKAGWQDGRAGFMCQSSDKHYNHGYNQGRQEYEYWNNPSDNPLLQPSKYNSSNENADISIGSAFFVVFIWLLTLTPVALFFDWNDGVFQAVFWSGAIIVGITYAVWFCNAIKKEREKKKRE